MPSLYPLIFQPVFKERIWGARRLEQLYRKPLPPGVPVGESWEISDRPGDVSVIRNGPLAGKDLHWLVQNHRAELLGRVLPEAGRFPLLIKLLDAREKLSLQVHPPADRAAELHGDPKTEMWYVAAAEPGAELYVGLNPGVTRAQFERSIQTGQVADCFHRIPVKAGDAMFLPSGRVHAIGAGLVIFEIQQNSDTTYRVFDWNRVGLDGKPRDLHIAESLASIDFNDYQPPLLNVPATTQNGLTTRRLVTHPLFVVDHHQVKPGTKLPVTRGELQVIGTIAGELEIKSDTVETLRRAAGEFCLLPASAGNIELVASVESQFLVAKPGVQ